MYRLKHFMLEILNTAEIDFIKYASSLDTLGLSQNL